MDIIAWENIGGNWQTGRENHSHSLVVRLTATPGQPSPRTFDFLHIVKDKFHLVPKRLEILVKSCTESWGHDFDNFLNQIKSQEVIFDELTCISLTRDTSMKEHGDLPDLSAKLLDLDFGILCTVGEEDLKDVEDNTLLVVFDESYKFEFNTMIEHLSKTSKEIPAGSKYYFGSKFVTPRFYLEVNRGYRVNEEGDFARIISGKMLPRPENPSPGSSLIRDVVDEKGEVISFVFPYKLPEAHLNDGYVPTKLLHFTQYAATFALKHQTEKIDMSVTFARYKTNSPEIVQPIMKACKLFQEDNQCANLVHLYGFRVLRKETEDLLGKYKKLLDEPDLDEQEEGKFTYLSSQLLRAEEYLLLYNQRCGRSLRDWMSQGDPSLLDPDFRIREDVAFGIIRGIDYLDGHYIAHGNLGLSDVYFTWDFICPVKIGNFVANSVKCFGIQSNVEEAWNVWSGGKVWSHQETNKMNYSIDWFGLAIILIEMFYLGKEVKSSELVTSFRNMYRKVRPITPLCELHNIIFRITSLFEEVRYHTIINIKLISKPYRTNTGLLRGLFRRPFDELREEVIAEDEAKRADNA